MTEQQKKYQGEAFIGVVGPETENAFCRDSIESIIRRPGDLPPRFVRATKGYEARQMLIDTFLRETRKDWLLLLDHDQTFPPDTLERLRSHGLPYVSGYYTRRNYQPVAPVWFEPWNGSWPMVPWTRIPERGQLHELGASGWGCILVHREVLEVVGEMLKGEDHVLEDDMDLWPYNLERIMSAIGTLGKLRSNDIPAGLWRPVVEQVHTVLSEEIRPLRGLKDIVGSDIRFPWYAREAGYQLYGDPDVRVGHMTSYPLSPNDFDGLGPESAAHLTENVKRHIAPDQQAYRDQMALLARLLEGGEA